MSEQIVFYPSPMSRGRIVHWMLEEVGASYRPHLLNLEKGEHKAASYLAINPMGKVPAIEHRGAVVTEVGAIITYLGDAFPAAGLAPKLDDPQRGTYLRWMFFSAGCIDNAIIDAMTSRPLPATRPGAIGYGSLEQVVSTLEQALTGRPYLLGDRFSAADLYVASEIGFGLMTQVLKPTPVFQAYLARVNQRPAAARWQQISDQWAKQMAG